VTPNAGVGRNVVDVQSRTESPECESSLTGQAHRRPRDQAAAGDADQIDKLAPHVLDALSGECPIQAAFGGAWHRE
jgi:hypothetical protein